MIKTELKPHQQEAVNFILKMGNAALIMGKGTGKTLIAFKLIEETKATDTLILTPSSASIYNWFIQGKQHTSWLFWRNNATVWARTPYGKVTVSTYASNFTTKSPTLVVFDESHSLKNRKAKRTKRAHRWIAKLPKTKRILMTATPASLHEIDLWSQYAILGIHPKWKRFETRFCMPCGFKNKERKIRDSMLEYYMKDIYPITFYQGSEVLDLPDNESFIVNLPFHPTAKAIYDVLKKEFILEFGEVTQLMPNALAKMSKLHQLCGGSVITDNGVKLFPSYKINWVINFIKNYRGKVVIFCAYNAEIGALADRLQYERIKVEVLYGNCDKRSWNRFQEDPKIKAFICQFRSGAQSIDLHAASVAVYYSNTFNYIDFDQSLGRIRRMGQTTKTLAYYLQIENSIDELIYANLTKKEGMLRAVFDAMRSTPQEKEKAMVTTDTSNKPKKHKPRDWSEEELATLASLWGKVTAREIGLKLNRSKSSVIGKAYRLRFEETLAQVKSVEDTSDDIS